MFWTAFIWGAGVSTGASVGLMLFLCLFGLFEFATKKAIVKEANSAGDEMFALLRERIRNEQKQNEIHE